MHGRWLALVLFAVPLGGCAIFWEGPGTPLARAAHRGDVPVIRALLAGGAPVLAGLRRRWMRIAGSAPIIPLGILIPFVLVAVFAPALAPYDPTEPIPGAGIFEPPFWVEAPTRRHGSAPTSRVATCSAD